MLPADADEISPEPEASPPPSKPKSKKPSCKVSSLACRFCHCFLASSPSIVSPTTALTIGRRPSLLSSPPSPNVVTGILFVSALSPAPALAWERRKRIVAGIPVALFYIHEQLDTQIIHLDVKTSNVMLDSGYNARLGDFGLDRWLEHDALGLSMRSISVNNNCQFRMTETSRIGGTIGYLPPENFQKRGMATAKSDVLSFGVMVLEVATGRRRWTSLTPERAWRTMGLD
ncbi:hypothetical protein J5N97_013851 [Dioscorea zingiberensis]|uniref:Protein kinase domain-containing protein n=1 Tax=Dioscorea zingiberensis TaxID=325984 RepID=A0A9D5HJH1_9LILI|nr:hypothetical protein J5N97_013851 [Dioscorea zingiberensis]